jgi:porphobilinogen synthase
MKSETYDIVEDVQQGTDIVKPALSCLDLIRYARVAFRTPLSAYDIRGEYSIAKTAEQRGWIDGKRVAPKILTSKKRPGADIILTYFVKEELSRSLKETKL